MVGHNATEMSQCHEAIPGNSNRFFLPVQIR
jgi:hypothetical protein